MSHDADEPAPFLLEVIDRLPDRGRPALDLACGRGRNARALGNQGRRVIALDRDLDALRAVSAFAGPLAIDPLLGDLEAGHGIPLKSSSCDAILVFRFLFRGLSPEIERVLAPGGRLVYETFTIDQKKLGYGPMRDAFLLQPGELATLFPGLEIEHFAEGSYDQPRPQATARLLARKPG